MKGKKDYSDDARNFFLDEQNKKKKKELRERFGMQFMKENNDAPPEIIGKFLEQVKHFEESWGKAERKKLFEVLEFPEFKKIETIGSDKLKTEIKKVLVKYAEHNINIDIIERDEVSDEEYYRFLTEELPEHETDFIAIEGMTTNYIYEEFHPSKKLDAKNIIEWMTPCLFKKDKEGIKSCITGTNLTFNGKEKSPLEFTEELLHLFKDSPKNAENELVFKRFEFDDRSDLFGKVYVEYLIEYNAAVSGINRKRRIKLNLIFDLEKCEYGGFNVCGCSVK